MLLITRATNKNKIWRLFNYNYNYGRWHLQFAALHTHAGTNIKKEHEIKALFIIQTPFPATVSYTYYYIHFYDYVLAAQKMRIKYTLPYTLVDTKAYTQFPVLL